ncbi:MAG TPA: c-type cytochrome domain-containing protein, partial [Planctomycetaceae bacterium]|nr:c-type cytochrome domain-containing protein [Planctomycetaceae bacterium]
MPARAISLCFVGLACLVLSGSAGAAIGPEQLKQIAEIRKELGKVPSLISKKDHEDAERILDDSEQKLKQLARDAGVDDNHKAIAPLLKQIELKRAALAKKPAGGEGRSGGAGFETEVAPILVARCLTCHGETNPRGGLRLDTFGEIVKGCGGKLVVPKFPQESVLVQRITATGKQRMPRNGDALTADEIRRITTWIAAGAKFTGENSAPLASLARPAAPGKPSETATVTINKPSGDEKVSFINDIAPFMVNLCVGCHSGNGRGLEETGYSLETFEKLMRGGRGGRVVLPGKPDESRLWHLVGKQDPIKMPPGQSLITRTNHRNLEIWIREGAKFDGTDEQARAPLRNLVLT